MTGGFGFVDPPLIGTDLIEFDDLPGTDLVLLPVALEDELVLLELVLLELVPVSYTHLTLPTILLV